MRVCVALFALHMRNTYTPGAYLLLTGSLTGSAPVASTVATVSGTGTAASAAGLRGNGDGRSRIYLAASARIDADYHSGAAGWTIGLSLEAHGLEHEFGGDVVSASGDIRHSDLLLARGHPNGDEPALCDGRARIRAYTGNQTGLHRIGALLLHSEAELALILL